MNSRFVLLAVLAAVGLIAASAVVLSRASYATSSESAVMASPDRVTDWLHVCSQCTDPHGQPGYVRRPGRERRSGSAGGDRSGQPAGSRPRRRPGQECDLRLRGFSVGTPDAFGNAAVGQISVTASVLPDAATDDTMLQRPSLTPFGQTTGGGPTVTLGPGTMYQFNISFRAHKGFLLGRAYCPRVRLSLTVAGSAGYYGCESPLEVTDAGGS